MERAEKSTCSSGRANESWVPAHWQFHAHADPRTRRSRPHKEAIGQFDPNSLAPPRLTKEQSMSNSLPTEQEHEEGPQTDFFQIANGNARQACSVKTKFTTPATSVAISPSELE